MSTGPTPGTGPDTAIDTRADVRRALRRQGIERRLALDAEAHDALSAKVCAAVAENFPTLSRRRVAFCWPVKNEPDLRPLMRSWLMAGNPGFDASQARRRLGELQTHTAGIVQELRQLMMDLRPTLLDHLGLIPAVRSLAESQVKRAGVQIDIKVHGERRRLAPATEIALFRILQEAITNIAKHAKAKHGTVEISFNDASVAACIVDDGRGFDPVMSRATWRTFGLIGMEERVSLLGGTLRIESQENKGTRIALEIPTPPA